MEVYAKADILESHDLLVNIEKAIQDVYQVNLPIHLDPVAEDHPWGQEASTGIVRIDPALPSMTSGVKGQTRSKLIFAIMNLFFKHDQMKDLIDAVQRRLRNQEPNLWTVTRMDYPLMLIP